MRILLFVLLVSFAVSSCRTQKAYVDNYLQAMHDTSVSPQLLKQSVIQRNDLLHIQVYSSASDPSIDAPYNLRQGSAGDESVRGFLVDHAGEIEYPRLGRIKAEGLTKQELSEVIRARLAGQLNNPTVVIRFLNYRVTVLGEVGTPGVLNVPTERVTIFEALGMAGDITDYGKKTQVKVLREEEGRQKIGTIDLTSKGVFDSEFYQLRQNDVVIVEQSTRRIRETEEMRAAQRLGIATSIVATLAIVLNFFSKN